MNLEFLIASIGFLACFAAAYYALRFLYGYRVLDDEIQVVLFHKIPIFRIPLRDIRSIAVVTWMNQGFGLSTLRFGNRICREFVAIERKKAFIGRVFITPDQPYELVREVTQKMRQIERNM